MSKVLTLNNKIVVASNGKAILSPEGSTIPDGDELGYGTEPLSDLTGTTWYFNETLSFDNIVDEVTYAINLTCGNYSAASITIATDMVVYGRYIDAVPSQSYYVGEWYSSAARTITITGGTDATNQDLIDFITTNATQVTS